MAVSARVTNPDGTTDTFLADRVIGALSAMSAGEEATPINPGDTAGATPTLVVTGVARDRSDLAVGKGLYVDAEVQGVAKGTIIESLLNKSSNIVTLTADALLNRLNADVQAWPMIDGTSMSAAFIYYMSLVGIPAGDVEIDPDMAWNVHTLPGFKGNLWDYMKQLCTAYGYQIYSTGIKVGITEVNQTELMITESAGTSLTVNNSDRAVKVQVQNYRTTESTNAVFFAATEVYSLAAGETQEIKQQVKGTPTSLLDPVCVSGISPYPYTSAPGHFGQYVVTGADGYILAPLYWTDNGGSITAKVSEDAADEIIITMTAPGLTSRAPYRISEGAADRPALYITGYGALYDPEPVVIYTGDSDAPQDLVEIDNKFIGTEEQAYDRGVLTAGQYGGPQVLLTLTDIPALTLQRKPYIQYAPAPNLLRNVQASMGRAHGLVEGWGTYFGSFMDILQGVGDRVGFNLLVDNPINGAAVLRSMPGPTNLGSDPVAVLAQQQWLTVVTPGSTYAASFRLSRLSGSHGLKCGISWFNADGVYLSQTLSGTGIFVNGSIYTFGISGVAPATARFGCALLNSTSTLPIDYRIEAAQLSAGTGVVPTAFVNMPAVPVATWFGSIAGACLRYGDSSYRVLRADYGPLSVNMALTRCAPIADFNTVWAGQTIAQFNAAMGEMNLAQHAVRPLAVTV